MMNDQKKTLVKGKHLQGNQLVLTTKALKKKEPGFGISAGQTTWDDARIQHKITNTIQWKIFFQ